MVSLAGPDPAPARKPVPDRPPEDARGAGFTRQDRGQFLLVSGIVLTLGFMVVATTLVTMDPWQEGRDPGGEDLLVDEMDRIVTALERALESRHRPGQMNESFFSQVATAAQEALEQNAARTGVIATVRLLVDPGPGVVQAIVQQPGRCMGFDMTKGGGVVYGWDEATLEKGIVGAVYEVHVTDGRTSMRTHHYVRLQGCAADEIITFPVRWAAQIGIVEDFNALRFHNDQAMGMTEELDWENLVEIQVHPSIDQDTITITGWNHPNNILKLDGAYTEMPSRADSMAPSGQNHFRFQLLPPERMGPDDTLPNVTVEVTGYKDRDNDHHKLYLNVYLNESWEHPVLKQHVPLPWQTSDTVSVVYEELVEGTGEWSYEDINGTYWELTVEGIHQDSPNQKWHIDHFNMTGSMMMAQAYRLNVTFEWPEIPEVYVDHEVHLRYRVEPGTPDEGFRLEVRDLDGVIGDGEWMLVRNMTDTTALPDGWFDTGAAPITEVEGPSGLEPLPNRMEFRVIDTDHHDNWVPDDEDTAEIAFLQIRSRLADS